MSVVNALSKRLELEIRRDGKVYRQDYERGVPIGPLKEDGTTTRRGTRILFWPDPEIFETTRITSYNVCYTKLLRMAIGSSYPETGGKNVSGLHWDIIKNMKNGGEIYADGELIYKDGKFLI